MCGFLDMTRKATGSTEEKQINWTFIHISKNNIFGVSEDIIKEAKVQPTDWEKIFANHLSDEDLASGAC